MRYVFVEKEMDSLILNPDIFLEFNWNDIASNLSESYDYQRLDIIRAQVDKTESSEKNKICILLQNIFSMRLKPESINTPFEPLYVNHANNKRTAIIDDFSNDELTFLSKILPHIKDPWSKSRINDVLWLCLRPRNPDFARAAISAYVASDITPKKWIKEQGKEWERAVRLCLQINEREMLSTITNRMVDEIKVSTIDNKIITLCLAKLLFKLKIAKEHYQCIAEILIVHAKSLIEEREILDSRTYYELAGKMYETIENKELWVKCLVYYAETYELEGDNRNQGSDMAANSFYERALQAYRRIPKKYRQEYKVDLILKRLQGKIKTTGQETIENMATFSLPPIDIKEIVEKAISHVSEKPTLQLALLYFVGVNRITDYSKSEAEAKENLMEFSFRSLFETINMSNDGRVISKSNSTHLASGDEEIPIEIYNQMLSNFNLGLQLACESTILPALHRILQDFRVTRDFLELICYHSSIVPNDRVKLLASSLWFGFEYEFGIAIHLLCPQIEHIVRVKLKENGEITSTIDPDGIETENGLSSLMDNPKINDIFGKDLAFELKAIFTESLGSNLRNNTAHGLLDDDSSNNYPSIYAWWLALRLVLHAIVK